MAKCLVIADDLTGANATGVLLKKNNFDTYTLLSGTIAKGFEVPPCDCLVIPTDSRGISAREAHEAVAGVLDNFASDNIVLYAKRIDSTLRGNLGSETDAFLDKLGPEYMAVCVPCFPSSGRHLVGGYLLVGGVPLVHTDAAKDPKAPINTSRAQVLYENQSKYPVASLYLEDVDKGVEHVCRMVLELKAQGIRTLIIDSVTQEDMDIIARALMMSHVKFFPVDPGVFTATAAKYMIPVAKKPQANKVLCTIGSVNGVARAQHQSLLEDIPLFNEYINCEQLVTSKESREKEIARVAEQVLKNADDYDVFCVVGDGINPEKRLDFPYHMQQRQMDAEGISELINTALAEITYIVLKQSSAFKGIYSTGGDITAAINRRFGTVGLKLLDEVVPLAGYGEQLGGAFPGLKFISKGGMVGDDKAMVTCVRYLQSRI